MITKAQAEKIQAGFGHGHWADQARAALKLLTASEPARADSGRYEDDGETDEFDHLFGPGPASDRHEARRIAARAALSEDELYALLYPGER